MLYSELHVKCTKKYEWESCGKQPMIGGQTLNAVVSLMKKIVTDNRLANHCNTVTYLSKSY